MRWTETPIHFIDFEGNLTSGILEYGVVTLQGGEIVAAETRLCGARGRIRTSDTAIHGLQENDVAGHAPFAEEFDRFVGYRGRGPLAAHYAHAENTLLKSVWAYPRASPDFSRPGERVADWGPWVDSGRLYLHVFPALVSGQLEGLINQFQLAARLQSLAQKYCPPARQKYHAALFDALAGALLLLSLGERPEFKEMTLLWLLQMSTADPEKRSALQQRELF